MDTFEKHFARRRNSSSIAERGSSSPGCRQRCKAGLRRRWFYALFICGTKGLPQFHILVLGFGAVTFLCIKIIARGPGVYSHCTRTMLGTILPQYYQIMRNIVVLTLFITLWWTAEVCTPTRSNSHMSTCRSVLCVYDYMYTRLCTVPLAHSARRSLCLGIFLNMAVWLPVASCRAESAFVCTRSTASSGGKSVHPLHHGICHSVLVETSE